MAYFVVHYTYSADADLAARHRPAHREFINTLLTDGLVASGPWVGTDTAGAMLLFRAETADEITAELDHDPFLTEGVIVDREIREWNPVIGVFAP